MSRKKKLNKQTVIGIISLVVAAVIIFVFVPLLTGAIKTTTQVVRVSETIKVGERISSDNTELVDVNTYNLPSDIIKSQEDALNKYVTARLEPGDFILASKIVTNMVGSGNYTGYLGGDKRIVSVSIKDLASGVSGKLQAGDIVTVIDNAAAVGNRATFFKELKYVKVLAVSTDAGVDANSESTSKETLPATVTLLANENQAQLLAGLEKSGNIYFALVYRGEINKADEYLKMQDDYFANNSNSI